MGKMSKEERIARARAKVAKLRAVGASGQRSRGMAWKPKAKIYLHPDTEILDRQRVWFPCEVDEKDENGKPSGKKKVVSLPFVVPDDPKANPFEVLREKLREAEEIDPDEVVISVGKGRSKEERCKGEILGIEGYDFKKNLRPQGGFLCSAILVEDSKKKRPDKLKVEMLEGAKTLANELRKEIESEVDEGGEEEGNPFVKPYPFMIEFDETERGSDMYSARARTRETPEGDEELQALLDGECPDLSDEVEPTSWEDMLKVIQKALVIELDLEGSGAPRKSKSAKRVEDLPRRKRKEEPEEGEEEEKPRSKKKAEPKEAEPKKAEPKKTAKKVAPAKKLGWEPSEGEDYDICPVCREKVPMDAVKCPHPGCDAEYLPDGEEDEF